MVPDTKQNFNISTFGNLLGEGENVAFAYNASTATSECIVSLSMERDKGTGQYIQTHMSENDNNILKYE